MTHSADVPAHDGLFNRHVWLWATLVAVAALIPRCTNLADFFTVDEAYHWIGRVHMFSTALAQQHWSATFLTGHPGVTTTWLGSLGRQIALAQGIADEKSPLGSTTAYLAALRLPIAAFNGLVVVPGYLLLRRVLPAGTALLAALFWALSPFLIAFDRLLHVDGLTASFTTLSLLLLLVALAPSTAQRRFWLALVGSGVCAGFAVLSKSSGLVLLPWTGLVLAAYALATQPTWLARMRSTAGGYAAWMGAAVLTFWVCWPAMWRTPIGTFTAVIHEMLSNGGQPHGSGNYFLGEAIADPGPLFYPAVVLWRSGPFTCIGLMCLVAIGGAALVRGRRGAQAQQQRFHDWATVGRMLGFVVLFTLALSVAAKKFDRYLLPAWPAIEILAACGLAAAWRAATRRMALLTRPGARGLAGLGAGASVFLVMAGTNAFYQPYYMSFYNPLLGGGPVAERVLLIGWGEGMAQIGAWLEARPDVARGTVLSWIPPTLEPFLKRDQLLYDVRNETIAERNPPPNYAVLYARSALRHETPEPEAFVRQTPALYTLRMFGIEYATIHQLPKPYDTPLGTSFAAGALGLRGYSMHRLGATLTITPSWDVRRDQPGGTFLFVHVLDQAGKRVGQIDAPIDDGMFPTWQRGQQFGAPLPIGLPANPAPGTYRVLLGAYRPNEPGRVPIDSGALPPDLDGPDVVQIATFSIGSQ